MRMHILFLAVLLYFGSSRLYGSTADPTFTTVWENILKVDDHEKNFRFPAVLDSLQNLAAKQIVSGIGLPSGWKVQKGEGDFWEIWAAILPFNQQPDRLIWLLFENGQRESVRIFNRNLELKGHEGITSIEMSQSGKGEIVLTSLLIKSGAGKLVEFPDIKIKLLFDKLAESRLDSEMEVYSDSIWNRLSILLEEPGYFDNSFAGYDKLTTLISSDRNLKVCTWNIEYLNGENSFYGGIVTNVGNNINVFRLNDSYKTIRSPEQASLTPSRWFGAIYYEMVETRHRGDVFYTLLGYNGNNAFSKIRVVESVTIASNGTPRLSNAIFADERRTLRRLIYEYSNRANMMLRYDHNQRMIVMDNLAPYDSMFENDFRYYGPDFTYNGLKFEKGKWIIYNEIDLRNPAPPRRGN